MLCLIAVVTLDVMMVELRRRQGQAGQDEIGRGRASMDDCLLSELGIWRHIQYIGICTRSKYLYIYVLATILVCIVQ